MNSDSPMSITLRAWEPLAAGAGMTKPPNFGVSLGFVSLRGPAASATADGLGLEKSGRWHDETSQLWGKSWPGAPKRPAASATAGGQQSWSTHHGRSVPGEFSSHSGP